MPVRLVAQLWLRAGNSPCGGNATAFFLDLWENLPRHMRLRGVRADAGFCLPELLNLWEQLRLPYVVVAQLSQPIQQLLKSDLAWQEATECPACPGGRTGISVAALAAAADWCSSGIRLREPEDRAQASACWTCRVIAFKRWSPVCVRRRIPRWQCGAITMVRRTAQNVIKELREGFALPSLCLEKFWATEAAEPGGVDL
ncbi:MAG: hypothetical protein U1F83_00135 [Verrucomicrobiota bacterium]